MNLASSFTARSTELRSALVQLALRAVACVLLASAALSLFPSSQALAQTARIHHQVQSWRDKPPTMGRDLWFMILTGYQGATTAKWLALYITSPNATTAWIQFGNGPKQSVPIKPYKTTTFNMPLGWEATKSGIPEEKAIHVWSNDADLCCYVMNHGDFTSDGFYVYPMIGWGKEYVVSAYGALFAQGADQPSEFGVVASTDGTSVRITPSVDIRKEGAPGASCDQIWGKTGVPQTILLNRGECVQFKTTCTNDCGMDVTGTVVTANNPVGVVCGSQCPFIPCDFGYCDHVCEMVPPVRMWAKTYYTVPFYTPPGSSKAHQASTFIVAGSKGGQQIWRQPAGQTTPNLFATVGKYQTFERNDVEDASIWFSDAPFQLTQYINSSTYPDKLNGKSDPAEVVVPPVEKFTQTAVFQLPVFIGSNGLSYTNYVNVIAKVNDHNVYLDTINLYQKMLTNQTRIEIDGKYVGYRVPNLESGQGHVVRSDSGVGVYIYGYGNDESYGWTGNFANSSFGDPDSIPPMIDTIGQCLASRISVFDSIYGMAPTGLESGLQFIGTDSIYNMGFILDSAWQEGKGLPTGAYDIQVIDPTKPAIIVVSAYDQAGNKTTITSTYIPQVARLGPILTDFGVGNNQTCTYFYDTLTNTGKLPYTYNSLRLALGTEGFTIDSSASTKSIDVGEISLVKICFKSLKSTSAVDTLIIDDGCVIQRVVLVGSGGTNDFLITDHDFGMQVLGTSSQPAIVKVHKTIKGQALSFDSMYVEDPVHFVPTPTNGTVTWIANKSQAITVPAGTQELPVEFTFVTTATDAVGPYQTNWWTHSPELDNDGHGGWRSNILKAQTQKASTVFGNDINDTVFCVNASNDTVVLKFTIKSVGSFTSTITNILNDTVMPQGFGHHLVVYKQDGTQIMRFDTMNQPLTTGSEIYVYDTVALPQGENLTYEDTIWVTELNPDGSHTMVGRQIIGRVTTVYSTGTVAPNKVLFTPVRYKSAAPPVQTFTFTNDQTVPVTVNSVAKAGVYAGAYAITSSPTLPVTLQPNEKIIFTVQFDPGTSFDSAQPVDLTVMTAGCANPMTQAIGLVTVGGGDVTSYGIKTYSICSIPVDSVHVLNFQPRTANGDVVATIDSGWFIQHGSDSTFFFDVDPKGMTIHGQDSISIPVRFRPAHSTGNTPYGDTVVFILKSSRSVDTVRAAVASVAASIALTAQLGTPAAPGVNAADIDQNFTVPLTFTMDKHGISQDLSVNGIQKVRVTIEYNSDLLHFDNNDIVGSFSPASGWSVDKNATTLTLGTNRHAQTPDKLVLVLNAPTGGLSDANVANAGSLKFHVMLTDSSDYTPLKLTQTELLDVAGVSVDPCVTVQSQSSDFTAHLLCGDVALRKVLNGATAVDIVHPATPDPVTGNTVTISFKTPADAVLTLSIFDALGKEVSRPLDAVHETAGSWQMPCSVANLPSGTYTYRLTDGSRVISKQFVIQR